MFPFLILVFLEAAAFFFALPWLTLTLTYGGVIFKALPRKMFLDAKELDFF